MMEATQGHVASASTTTTTTTSPQLKRSYKEKAQITSFYTGGQAVQSKDESVLCATHGDDVKIVSLETGQVLQTLVGDTEAVTSFAVDSTAKRIAIASRSLQVRIVKLADGTVERSFRALNVPVVVMDIDASDTLVAVGGSDGSVRIWDMDKGYATHNFKGHKTPITCVKFHPDQNHWTLFSASADGDVRSWDIMTSKQTAQFKSHVSAVPSIAVSADGHQIATAGRDQVVNVWDLRTNELVKTITIMETIEAVEFVPADLFGAATDETPSKKNAKKTAPLVLTAGEKGVLRVWNTETGAMAYEQRLNIGGTASPIVQAFWNKGWSSVGVVTLDQMIHYFELPSFAETRSFVGSNDEVVDLRYIGPSESHLVVATASDKLRLYDLQTMDCRLLKGHTDIVLCVDVSLGGTTVVSGSKDNQVRVWHVDIDSQSVTCVGTAIGHMASVGAVALPKRAASKFFLSGSEDRTVKCWDLSTVEMSSDVDEPQRITTKYTTLAHDKDINSIALAPNDKLFATGSQDRTAKLWSTADGSLVGVLRGHKRGIWSVAFSPVDQVVATASGDQTIRLWSVKDFSCLKTFEGHQNSVLRVQFLSMGMQLVSVGSDGLIKLWTIKANECLATIDAHEDKAWALAVKRDESEITTGSADSVVRVWTDNTQQEIDEDIQQQAEQLEQEQELSNMLYKKDYTGAVRMCLKLDQPRRLAHILTTITEDRSKDPADEKSVTGSIEVDKVIEGLGATELERLFAYCRDWNTNSKVYRIAQIVLHKILKFLTPQRLIDLPNSKQLLQALIPYSERHLARLDTLVTRSYIVDYILRSMDSLHPATATESAEPMQLDEEAAPEPEPAPQPEPQADPEPAPVPAAKRQKKTK